MMGVVVTVVSLVASAVIAVAANILARRPLPFGEVRMIPYGAVQFIAMVAVVVLAAHLFSLLTGEPLKGRLGY